MSGATTTNPLERKECLSILKSYDGFLAKAEQVNKLKKQLEDLEGTMDNGRANVAKLKALIAVDEKELDYCRQQIAEGFNALIPKQAKVVEIVENNGTSKP